MKRFQEEFNQEVILSAKREARPFVGSEASGCPFCPQNKEILAKLVMEEWLEGEFCAKIVANKYPISSEEGARGIHEVVIDTLDHEERPKDFSERHWRGLLSAMQKRWHQIEKDPSISFIQIFKNDGTDAGASIRHSHWQILALEQMPYKLIKQYSASLKRWGQDCYLCRLDREGFLIFENNEWSVWVPPVPEFNGEVWLVPKRHVQHFGQLESEELNQLGILIRHVLLAYEKMKPGVAYNICMISGGLHDAFNEHFYVKLVMRMGHIAGFEIATGCHIITMAPESYAEEIKKILKGMYK